MDIAVRLVGGDAALREKVKNSTLQLLKKLGTKHNPPYIATVLFRNAYRLLGHDDPYLALKKEYNEKAKKFHPFLEKLIARAADPLAEALKMALAGNIIDFGILEKFDLDKTLKKTLKLRLPQNKVRSIRKRIAAAKTILYIADNAGEIGFDYFLISEIHRINPLAKIYLSVKKTPIINDATKEDALFFGLGRYASILDSGDNWIGTHPRLCSKTFLKAYDTAGLIISKGQANYESLEEQHDPRILFLLKSKCPVVSRSLKVKLNDVVMK